MTDMSAKTIRDRDELWCRCLGTALDPHEILEVLKVFNSVRPDKPVTDQGVV